jgi:hypothetical protein
MNITARHFDDNADTMFEGQRPIQAATNKPGARQDSTRRKRRAPQQFNGIHRRRRKKIRW